MFKLNAACFWKMEVLQQLLEAELKPDQAWLDVTGAEQPPEPSRESEMWL